MQELLFLFVGLLASVTEAICGIGGGVVIRPTLDAFKRIDAAIADGAQDKEILEQPL